MASSAGLGDNSLELIDLRLSATECTKLWGAVSASINSKPGRATTYSLLGQLTGTLVLAVTEEFDNATLIWCESVSIELAKFDSLRQKGESVPRNLLDDLTNKSSTLAQVALGSADSWLDDARLGLLYFGILLAVHLL